MRSRVGQLGCGLYYIGRAARRSCGTRCARKVDHQGPSPHGVLRVICPTCVTLYGVPRVCRYIISRYQRALEVVLVERERTNRASSSSVSKREIAKSVCSSRDDQIGWQSRKHVKITISTRVSHVSIGRGGCTKWPTPGRRCKARGTRR